MAVSILGCGVAVPKLRIKREEYAKAWGSFAAAGVNEKAVLGFDEDVLTLGARAGRLALESARMASKDIRRLAFATTSAPYTEKLLGATIVAGLGLASDVFCSDHTTSTRAGTEAVLAAAASVAAAGGPALVVASDAPRASVREPLEHPMGAGAAAVVLHAGTGPVTLEGVASQVAEYLGERFRASDEPLTRDLQLRRYSEDAFVTTTTGAAQRLLRQLGRSIGDFAHVIVQQPDGRLPKSAAGRLGAKDPQLAAGFLVASTGDTGAASTLLGLAGALDATKPQERLLVVSYGSGAGSDALGLLVNGANPPRPNVSEALEAREYIDYLHYLKLRDALI